MNREVESMPTNYSKGRNLECSVKKKLETAGYTVFKGAGSRPFDLVYYQLTSKMKELLCSL